MEAWETMQNVFKSPIFVMQLLKQKVKGTVRKVTLGQFQGGAEKVNAILFG